MLSNDMANLFPKVGTNINFSLQNAPRKVTSLPRKMYTIRNFTPGSTVFIGYAPEVSIENGFPILAGEVIYLNTAADVYILSDQVGDKFCDVRIMILS